MLNRQKIVVQLINLASRPVSRIELVKLAFLLREESPGKGGNAFYEFLPYKYGPFSFTLYWELDKLRSLGLLELNLNDQWVTSKCNPFPHLSGFQMSDILFVLDRYSKFRPNQLLNYVYNKYPWYSVRSLKRRPLIDKIQKPKEIYTIGYSSLQIDGLINRVLKEKIKCIADVRNNPIARRYGFHASTMRGICEKMELEYLEAPELGVSADYRIKLQNDEDYRLLLNERYPKILLDNEKAVQNLATAVCRIPTVLLCRETDPKYCHRSVLAEELSSISGLPVVHLR